MEAENEYCLQISTLQSTAIKILVEALKDILTDVNFVFNETGIKLITTDPTKTVLIHMKLGSDKFEKFYCPDQIICGVNILNLHKLIKTITTLDTLTLYIKKNNLNKLGIQINNNDKKTQTVYELNLLDIDAEDMKIPPVSFDSELSFPSSDFQKIIRDMVNIGDVIDITSYSKTLKLTCKGDFASQETVMHETEEEGTISFNHENNTENIVQGSFSLKYLILFTKCTNLCNLINIFLKNDYPLIIQYNVAQLGTIKLCLAPNIEDN
tara:strand:- start:192 stop:992 length:801 start_codon:yes stop_codon:yes gene_type:complete